MGDLDPGSAAAAEAWFGQAHRHLTGGGYTIEAFETRADHRRLVATHPERLIRVAMGQYLGRTAVEVSVQSACVPEPAPSGRP
ncbi:hypothetical protein [Actinoplanes sp. NPDC023714]|uniref:hypothetical protein n=1 Tax=Actinoplanes sp. NPDC023714 TaxID=3154322 RepID=UPI0033F1984B